jgi:hypothetical protein
LAFDPLALSPNPHSDSARWQVIVWFFVLLVIVPIIFSALLVLFLATAAAWDDYRKAPRA